MKTLIISSLISLWAIPPVKWASVQQAAIEENKKVLLVFSGSDWCHGCIRYENETLSDPAFTSFAADQLIIYKADFPRKKSNQPSLEVRDTNIKLANLYNPKGIYPLILVIDKQGEVLIRQEGFASTDNMIKMIRSLD